MRSGRSWCVEALEMRRIFESLFQGGAVERFNHPSALAKTVALRDPLAVGRDTSGTPATKRMMVAAPLSNFRERPAWMCAVMIVPGWAEPARVDHGDFADDRSVPSFRHERLAGGAGLAPLAWRRVIGRPSGLRLGDTRNSRLGNMEDGSAISLALAVTISPVSTAAPQFHRHPAEPLGQRKGPEAITASGP